MAADLVKLFDLTGKVVLVTGAAGAICGEIAETLAGNGVKTIILDISDKKVKEKAAAIRRSGGTVLAYSCDITNKRRVEEVYSDVVKKWGIPDFIVNGAGGNKPEGTAGQEFIESEDLENNDSATIFDMDPDHFKSVVDLNFYGTLYIIQVFGKGMVKKGAGSIVNISSMSGITPLTKVAAYSSAKAAVINFTRWMAVYLAHTGVRVNTIAPGFILTKQSRFLQFDKQTGKLNKRGKAIIEKTPMGRFGRPEEIIGALVWLLSEGSGFVTGTVIPVDGGFSAYSL